MPFKAATYRPNSPGPTNPFVSDLAALIEMTTEGYLFMKVPTTYYYIHILIIINSLKN